MAGPILFVLALEHGRNFAATAATASTAAVFASVTFSLAYAHVAQRASWRTALGAALLAWFLAAYALSALPHDPRLSLAVAICTLLAAPTAFPSPSENTRARSLSAAQVGLRMGAGALLTMAVSAVASEVGGTWSGLLAVFPVLGMVLAVFSHRADGPLFAATLLRAMATGLYSFATFCSALAMTLPHMSLAAAFVIATGLALTVQAATKRWLTR